MYESRFSRWARWEDRDLLDGVEWPGIYIITHTSKNIKGRKFIWRPEIIYIGMTNAAAGLKGRLRQFDNTIRGQRGHGGADRVRHKHQSYPKLIEKLFVSVVPFKADVKSNQPKDLKTMGDVARFEYQCFAQFVEKFGTLPEFNDKKNSPKYSRTHRQ